MRQCEICGSTKEMVEVTQIDTKKVIWDFGYYPSINEDTIQSKKTYCNAHFLELVWYPKMKIDSSSTG